MKKPFIYLLLTTAAIFVAVFFATNTVAQDNQKNVIILTASNTLTLNEAVDARSVGEVISNARKLGKQELNSNAPVILFLSTPGGSIQAGLELIEAMKGIDREIKTVTSFSASMGFQIAQNLGERLILESGVMMSHHAKGGFDGEFGGTPPSQVESRHNFWKQRMSDLDNITVSRSKGKQTIESYQIAYENELWLTARQAVEQGYADRIVSVKCDKSLNGTNKKSVLFFGMEVSYDLDKCPLNTAPMNIRMKMETTQGVMDSVVFLEKGGQFGSSCLLSPDKKLCPMDTTLTLSKLEEIKAKFINNYIDNKSKVVNLSN